MTTSRQSPETTTTRRGFLKKSAAGAAVLGGLSVARGAHAAGDDIVKIGMIGCGGRCSGAAAQSMNCGPYVKLVAMTDVFESRVKARLKGLKAQHPDQVLVDDDHCFVGLDGYKKVIECADVVLIACASKFHPMYSEAAIKAGKHVFVEKPHAIDPVGVRRVKAVSDLAEQKGLSIVSGLQSRFHAGWRETVKRIHDGAIGKVVAAQSMFLRAPYRTEARQPGLSELQYQFWNWYHFLWLSGDDVPQSLVHNVDRISWIMQEEMPTWAFGLAGRSSSFGEVYGDMFDHNTVVYEYDSGARLYALCRTQKGCYNNSGDIIMGTKGTCQLARCRIQGETNWQFEGTPNNPYQAEQQALMDAVRSGQPVNSGSYMANSTMIGVLGQITRYTGKETKWDDAVKSDLQYGPSPEEASLDMDPPTTPDETGNYPLMLPGITKLL
ncbi:MAG: Gfo/Idh/MocA family oxidoreductase [Planctomycetota bacterium]|jgi:predicted dehydrogenase